MAAPVSDDDAKTEEDFYAILNVRKEANDEELKSSYRRLCMFYHPDKHESEEDKAAAKSIFTKVQEAYTVLSQPEKRAIYDVYGKKGLEADWQVVPRTRTPAEIIEEYQRLQKENAERKLQQSTNPRGSVTVGIDATELFDSYHYDEDEDFIPHIEVKNMSIHQSIDAPLTVSETATFSGTLSTQNGNGTGNVSASCRSVLSSKTWGECSISAGTGPVLALKVFHNISRRSFVTCSGICQVGGNGLIAPGLVTVASRQLDKQTVGYLTWKWGMQSSMNATVMRDTSSNRFTGQIQLGLPNTFVLASYTQKFPGHDAQLTGTIKASVFGTYIEYGGDKKVSTHSRLGAKIAVGVPMGVTLKIRLVRANQVFLFPVHLSQEICPQAILYGTLTPIAIYFFVKAVIVTPFLKKQKESELEKQRASNRAERERRKQEAETEIRLMQDVVQRNREVETSRQGLILEKAWYGKLVSDVTADGPDNISVIDVTIPLQCQVKDSKLLLTDVSKTSLPGFYDPCIGEDKSLKVRYYFRGKLHECTVQDNEPLRIPKQSHMVDTR
ncbi:dnaJ homolog subfamily C member 11-like [Apostichopus japonicus]|uniref:dnaJ homolog subfamily C member 11-like n=1 Tax=Stichopus japonicus TaxID=307972 RepID=UPI003AB53B6F